MDKNSQTKWDLTIPNPKFFDREWSLLSTGVFVEAYPSEFTILTMDNDGICTLDGSIEVTASGGALICKLISGSETIGIVGIVLGGPHLSEDESVVDKLVDSEEDEQLPIGLFVNDENTKYMNALGDISSSDSVVFGPGIPDIEGMEPTDEEVVVKIQGNLSVFEFSSQDAGSSLRGEVNDLVVLLKTELAGELLRIPSA